LNDAALATISAMEEMQQSGMASGMEQFLERMQQMTGQQQGINNQTLQMLMGQMTASAQKEMMQRLGQQQGQLRKSLQELINETRGSRQSGELQGIAEQMEEVLKDFRRRRVNRKTVERQERIMSRMLNSQKSLKQRDLSEMRKSRTSDEVVSDGPAGLPADLGQRRNLAIEALNEALKAGFPRDYQEMIRRYFNSLIQDETVETDQ
jgi:response regulator of citrate/malate metabolism